MNTARASCSSNLAATAGRPVTPTENALSTPTAKPETNDQPQEGTDERHGQENGRLTQGELRQLLRRLEQLQHQRQQHESPVVRGRGDVLDEAGWKVMSQPLCSTRRAVRLCAAATGACNMTLVARMIELAC